MGKRDKRFDTYINESAEFAQPILKHIRELVHEACPDIVEEFKWGHPHFTYEGSIICGMASFKQHVGFGFWKASLIMGTDSSKVGPEGMGQFGKLTTVKQLPSKKVLTGYVKAAMKLNEAGIPAAPRRSAIAKKAAAKKSGTVLKVPADLIAALELNRAALDTFDAFSPSARKEYIEWITEAKQQTTRERRLEQAIEWMADGKQRNWKYQK